MRRIGSEIKAATDREGIQFQMKKELDCREDHPTPKVQQSYRLNILAARPGTFQRREAALNLLLRRIGFGLVRRFCAAYLPTNIDALNRRSLAVLIGYLGLSGLHRPW
jgi:hypothetical protein